MPWRYVFHDCLRHYTLPVSINQLFTTDFIGIMAHTVSPPNGEHRLFASSVGVDGITGSLQLENFEFLESPSVASEIGSPAHVAFMKSDVCLAVYHTPDSSDAAQVCIWTEEPRTSALEFFDVGGESWRLTSQHSLKGRVSSLCAAYPSLYIGLESGHRLEILIDSWSEVAQDPGAPWESLLKKKSALVSSESVESVHDLFELEPVAAPQSAPPQNSTISPKGHPALHICVSPNGLGVISLHRGEKEEEYRLQSSMFLNRIYPSCKVNLYLYF